MKLNKTSIYNSIFCVLIACFMLSLRAATDDVFVSYRTRGTDRYVDGTVVSDGECYALICTKKGASFGGFTADGRVSVPEFDDIAVIAPAAVNGHCRRVVFGLPKDYVAAHKTDVWSVYLLDTRTAEGYPAGLVNGIPARINGYGLVEGEVSLGGAMVAFGRAEAPVRATLASAVPPSLVPQPVIRGIEVKDGQVVLSVDDTVPFVTYDLVGASSPNALQKTSRCVARHRRDGVVGETITLEADVDDQVRFFRVVRAE